MPTANDPAAEIQAIKADLTALRDDMSSLSRSLVRRGVRKAKEARDAVEQQIADAGESVEDFVHDRPFTSMALAFGAGALLVALMRRH